MKAYKYRIYPNKTQATAIDSNIETCRQLYNKLLGLKITAYEKDKTRLSRFDLNKKIKGTTDLHSQVCQNVSNRIDKSFKNFFAYAIYSTQPLNNPCRIPRYVIIDNSPSSV